MSMAAGLGLAAGLAQAVAYVVYFAQVVRADCRPNGMTWLMWAYGSAVFFAIELHIGVPASVLILPGVCMVSAISVAGYAFVRSAYLPPRPQDWAALTADATLMAGYVGVMFATAAGGRPPEGASLVFVALAGLTPLTSSWPTLRTTCAAPRNERPLAWFVWSAAYGLLTLAAMAEGLAWPFLVYPVLSQVLCALIGILASESDGTPPVAEHVG